ncbi:hypothetical protein [Fischerella sp. NIES-3754]|uniref:hypothetical protein n=1 Tax=Fischerella sp. NIES-3754 TaxID=1752063 RepID=UPI000A9F67EB|nr:hypothetical protein [Fischerella sp. NIES-3754]
MDLKLLLSLKFTTTRVGARHQTIDTQTWSNSLDSLNFGENDLILVAHYVTANLAF